jgi:hypothetical protein
MDFFDSGNGKLRVSIDFFRGDETADLLSACDPYFVIKLDSDMDGIYDIIETSSVSQDSEMLYDPFFIVVDVLDGQINIGLSVEVYDSDIDYDDSIDYTPLPSGDSYYHTIASPYSYSWSYDGDSDNVNEEVDCEISYSISVV